MRDTATQTGECLDTLASSWLGPRFVRKQTGTEYYFNSYSDTIEIRTNAHLGENWTLVKGVNGIIYKGTIVDVGITNVDSTVDSFKTIAIQADSNNVAVPSIYNSLILQISKAHGWLKTLDFYTFPNYSYNYSMFAQLLSSSDTAQHTRLSRAFARLDLNFIDLGWKYKPGNEWIRKYESGIGPSDGANKSLPAIQ